MNTTKAARGGFGTGNLALRRSLIQQRDELKRCLAKIEQALYTNSGAAGAPRVTHPEVGPRVPVPPARSSPWDTAKGMLESTADLREPNGNLSATRVAKLFGVSLSQLAQWLGRSKQAISKTPDADSLQDALGYFERMARLRLITKSDVGFRKWLRMPHPEVAAKNPLELLARGEWQALADWVDDILSGTPG